MHELNETSSEARRAIAVAVQTPDVDDEALERSLAELERLATTLGHRVVGKVHQKRAHFDPGHYVGAGKVGELKARIEAGEADLLLVDHEISPSQARNLEKDTGAEVLDRTAVILEIFQRHARSRAAKAQVEIVRLEYMAPRMREQGKGQGDRQRGGIGGKGEGESKMELDRRKIRDRIKELREQLEELEEERRTQRARRKDLRRAALVGYTNAGKSTLMRALTHSDVYVADKLFATLETTVRTLEPPARPPILVSDTVGFIHRLPHDLVASFKSTLDEALEASLLLHVVDASDPAWRHEKRVTEEVLSEIGAADVPRLVVLNKIDRVADEAAAKESLLLEVPGAVVMSALRDADVTELRRILIDHFAKSLVVEEVLVPHTNAHALGEVYQSCEVLAEAWDEVGGRLQVRTTAEGLARVKRALGAT